MILTLAERFNMTGLHNFKRRSSQHFCLVEMAFLCIQLVVSTTITLMLDQVTNLKEKGINAVYLGSAQLDFSVEDHALSPESDINLVFVTPE